MSIRKLTKEEFEAFGPTRDPLLSRFVDEDAWYAAGDVIATLVQHRTDHYWSFTILGRDEHGRFRLIDVGASWAAAGDAEYHLKNQLEEFERAGPQREGAR